jgi:VanZ family protein
VIKTPLRLNNANFHAVYKSFNTNRYFSQDLLQVINQNSNHKPVFILSLLIIGLVMAMFIESSQPPLQLLEEVKGLDKAAHFLAFNVLGLLVCGLYFSLNPKPTIRLFSMPLLIVSLSGLIEESYQMFIPGRSASLLDLLADICGAACAIMVANRVAILIRINNQIIQKQ